MSMPGIHGTGDLEPALWHPERLAAKMRVVQYMIPSQGFEAQLRIRIKWM